ncbi:hypothetical protein GCM10009584_10910 [Ornithinimicrobium humiphilum]|uniref:Chromosome partitioning protein n=1 Tax=Ornithinimicrobium humiphilum TaxID=125288 RepID=A0A543KJE3_9MICO|nr:ParA family protein [Ornithinimicrobium humiphilum]TQM95199.1 chromosome partitioning protein [Ornithinimicrobium humiphilum]
MTTTHHGALGWPGTRPTSSFDAPSGAARTGLGWPGSASLDTLVGGDVSRETSTEEGHVADIAHSDGAAEDENTSEGDHRPAGGQPAAPERGAALQSSGGADVSRETEVSRETSTGIAQPDPTARTHGWTGTRILTVANQKGGVGKTTSTVNIAAAMAEAGLRVLVVDMDPQGNASTALSIPHQSGTTGIYDVLIDGVPLEEVVRESPHVPGLLGAPATIDLAGAEIELVPLVAREHRLRRALDVYLSSRAEGDEIDLVLIDCPPSLGLLTVNAFVAAREVLIPIQCEYYALEGLSQLLKNVELIQQHLNAELEVSTILLTMYDARTRLSADVAAQVREYFGPRVLRAAIPRSVRISEAPSHGETVITYDPTSTGALSYVEAAAEMRQLQEVSA